MVSSLSFPNSVITAADKNKECPISELPNELMLHIFELMDENQTSWETIEKKRLDAVYIFQLTCCRINSNFF